MWTKLMGLIATVVTEKELRMKAIKFILVFIASLIMFLELSCYARGERFNPGFLFLSIMAVITMFYVALFWKENEDEEM